MVSLRDVYVPDLMITNIRDSIYCVSHWSRIARYPPSTFKTTTRHCIRNTQRRRCCGVHVEEWKGTDWWGIEGECNLEYRSRKQLCGQSRKRDNWDLVNIPCSGASNKPCITIVNVLTWKRLKRLSYFINPSIIVREWWRILKASFEFLTKTQFWILIMTQTGVALMPAAQRIEQWALVCSLIDDID